MENYQIEAALLELKGKRIVYKEKPQQVLRFEMKNGLVKMTTDVQDIVIMYDDLEATLKEIKKAESTPPASQNLTPTVISANASTLADTLLNNIKKVQQDASYIPQAMEIKNQADTLISLAKTEIEYMKTMKSLRES